MKKDKEALEKKKDTGSAKTKNPRKDSTNTEGEKATASVAPQPKRRRLHCKRLLNFLQIGPHW
jgi:hypothetical protein